MIVHQLKAQGGVLMHSYGSVYYVFVTQPTDEVSRVTIYDPSSGETTHTCDFRETITSIVTLRSTVYICVDTGHIVELQHSASEKAFKLSSFESLRGWKSEGKPIRILGIDDDVMYIATSNSNATSCYNCGEDRITLYYRWQAFPVTSRRHVVQHRFDSETHQLSFVTEKDQSYHLHVIGIADPEGTRTARFQNHSYKIQNPWAKSKSFWYAEAISRYGEVAFTSEGGRFWIVNPTLPKSPSQYVTVGSILKENAGGNACFAGPEDTYLAYSGLEYSEIAAVKYVDGRWTGVRSLIAETGNLYMRRRYDGSVPMTSLYDLGTDGGKLIVRVGPDEIDEHSEGATSNMLWTFDLCDADGLKLI